MLARMLSTDAVVGALDQALRTLSRSTVCARPMPQPPIHQAAASDPQGGLTREERALSGALMRVNHVGEVCAQALYSAQALSARSGAMRQQMQAAARDEGDHLAWCERRLTALGARPSLLNPLWYAGAFTLGLIAGRAGDARSLGFVVETERQVEQHLNAHLQRLPAADLSSRAVVQQMAIDEAGHAEAAAHAGATPVPMAVAWLMRRAAAVMTRTAHVI